MEDDNRSVASGGSTRSTREEKVGCPHCPKSLQIRAVFKHIHGQHYKEFLDLTSAKWIDDAEVGEPLRIMWDGHDEQGEPELKTYWVCLSTYKTFMGINRANLHFQKNKKALKEHNDALKKLKKDYIKAQEKKKKELAEHPVMKSYREAKVRNSPELARCLWRSILYYSRGAKMLLNRVAETHDDNFDMFNPGGHNFNSQLKQLGEWREQAREKLILVDQLYAEKCLNWKLLEPLHMYFSQFVPQFMLFFNCFGDVYDFNNVNCIRANPQELEASCYWLCSPKFPLVDF
jgi:hypothetical protein